MKKTVFILITLATLQSSFAQCLTLSTLERLQKIEKSKKESAYLEYGFKFGSNYQSPRDVNFLQKNYTRNEKIESGLVYFEDILSFNSKNNSIILSTANIDCYLKIRKDVESSYILINEINGDSGKVYIYRKNDFTVIFDQFKNNVGRQFNSITIDESK